VSPAPTMKAAVLYGKEDVRIEQVPVPEPGPGDVLLRVEAALTCGTDVKVFRRGYHARMIVPPALFGHEVAGTVADPGSSGLRPGARVVPANSAPCGRCEYCRRGKTNLCDDLLFWNGAYAELARIPARIASQNLLPIPDGVSFRHAALTEPLACVLRGVEESGIEAGSSVVVIGTGPIGLMFVALARKRGAHVVAAGRRAEAVDRAVAMGAESGVVLSEEEDPAEILRRGSPGNHGPEIVIDASGRPETAEAALRAVRKGGVVNLFAGCPAGTRIAVDAQRLHYQELTIRSTFHHTPQSVRAALRLIADRAIDGDAFITAEAPLERLPDVLRAMAGGSQGLKTAIVPRAAAG
jgi:L-iditol 2-dehydrogenase